MCFLHYLLLPLLYFMYNHWNKRLFPSINFNLPRLSSNLTSFVCILSRIQLLDEVEVEFLNYPGFYWNSHKVFGFRISHFAQALIFTRKERMIVTIQPIPICWNSCSDPIKLHEGIACFYEFDLRKISVISWLLSLQHLISR